MSTENASNNGGMTADDQAGLAAFAAALAAATPADDGNEPDPTEEQPAQLEEEQPPVDAKGKPKPAAKPKRLKELGAYSKLSDAELYGIEVPSSVEGQKPYTLGQLKDLAAEHDEFALTGLQREQSFRDREAQLLRTEEELRDILGAIPKDAIPEKLRQQLQTRRDSAVKEERQRVLSAIPGWQDREVRTQELGAMIEHLKDHGFPEGYLANVVDHRTLRYIRSMMIQSRTIKAALEKVKQRKTVTPGKGAKPNAGSGSPRPTGGRPSTNRDQRAVDNFASVLFANSQRS